MTQQDFHLQGDFKAGSVLTSFISDVLSLYWDRSPTAVRVLSLIQGLETSSAPIYFDHFAFRTLGVPGMGISSIAKFFTDFGYQARDELYFPEKHLKAIWYAPPDVDLPRIFISELKVNEEAGIRLCDLDYLVVVQEQSHA